MAAKILLVEDDNNLREIYEARLQAEGYTIVTAKDGEEALVVAKAEQPNLVISDVMMPRISGFEMLDILRNTEDLKDTKVIMLTALGQADDKTRANSLGADRYLVKSQVTLEDIVKAAHELIDSGSGAPAAPVTAAPTSPTPAAPATRQVPSMPPQPAAPAPAPAATVSAPTPEPVTPSFSSMMGAQPAAMPAVPVPPTPAAPAFGSSMPSASVPALAPAPAPMPEPVVTPAAPAADPATMFATPSASPMPATPAPSASDLASPTTAEEKATVGAQIDSFVQNVGSTPAPMAPASSTATQDDAVLATAMNDLAANTEKPDEPAPAPMPEPVPVVPTSPTPNTDEPAADTSHGSVPIANKKIIQPLNSEPKQSIHELLAKEEAKDIMGGMPAAPAPTPTAPSSIPGMHPDALNTPAAPAPQAGNVFGPTNQMPVPPLPPSNPADPNNIAL